MDDLLPDFGGGSASTLHVNSFAHPSHGSGGDVMDMDGAEMQAVLQDSIRSATTDVMDMGDAALQAALQDSMMYGGDAEEQLQAALALSLASSSSSSSSSSAVGPLLTWQCTICTFVNDGDSQSSCSMCDSIRD